MLAREATKADIQAVCDRLREAKEQRQLDIQINQAIALVNRNHRRKKYDAERLSINANYILAGVLAGKFINAKGIKVIVSAILMSVWN